MAIHNESEQRDGPFISVDCQMLSPENILHELLGSDVGPSPSKFELVIMAPYIWIKSNIYQGKFRVFY